MNIFRVVDKTAKCGWSRLIVYRNNSGFSLVSLTSASDEKNLRQTTPGRALPEALAFSLEGFSFAVHSEHCKNLIKRKESRNEPFGVVFQHVAN